MCFLISAVINLFGSATIALRILQILARFFLVFNCLCQGPQYSPSMYVFQVKFSVQFVKGWPVLGRVRFCFANTPIVDMTARPNFKNGLDMRFIPGAANWLVLLCCSTAPAFE